MPISGNDVLAAKVALDTSAYSHLRRGHERIVDAVARADVVHLPVTVLGELEGGFRAGSRYRENRRALQELLDEPFVAMIETSQDVAHRYGKLFAELRRAGTPIPVNDIWIAAATMTVGAQLITFDRDFEAVAGLSLALFDPSD